MMDELEAFLFKPFKVTTLERILINAGCFVIGFTIGVELSILDLGKITANSSNLKNDEGSFPNQPIKTETGFKSARTLLFLGKRF